MWGRVRYRFQQALALMALAALVTMCACLGPLYQRAMEQALATTTLDRATATQTAVTTSAFNVRPEQMEETLPAALQPYLQQPIDISTVRVSVATNAKVRVDTRLYTATDVCAHVNLTRGRCPKASGEVVVSVADVATYHWKLGSKHEVEEKPDGSSYAVPEPRVATTRVVGVYEPHSHDSWLGQPGTGRAGTPGSDLPNAALVTDDWVTDSATVAGHEKRASWRKVTGTVVWPLDRPALVDVDDLLAVGLATERYAEHALQPVDGPGLDVSSNLPDIADVVSTGGTQGRVTVIALTLQLLVLTLVVFWLVLDAAVDQRRPEVALARLRGRGAGGAARFLLAELVPVTAVGVLVGGAATLGVVHALTGVFFPVGVPLEVTGAYFGSWAAAAVVTLLVVLLAVLRTVRVPVAQLLRAVPARSSGLGAGVAEVALVVFAATAVVAFVTGNLEGALGTAAPALLALSVAIVLGRLLIPVSAALGRWFLARGNAVAATGLLQATRRPITRRVLVLVVVSAALVVFAGVALSVGDHNRRNAAEQQLGAAVTLELDPSSSVRLLDVLDVLAEVDPTHRRLTPVVTVFSAGDAERPTVAVDPEAFGQVAQFAGLDAGRIDFAAIEAPDVAPLDVRGSRIKGRASFSDVTFTGASRRDDEVTLDLVLATADGVTTQVPIAVVTPGDSAVRIRADLPCEEMCQVTGLTLATPPARAVRGAVTLSGLHADDDVDLAPASRWRATSPDSDGSIAPVDGGGGGLGVRFDTSGASPPVMYRTWVPEPVPALVVAPTDGDSLLSPGLDGQQAMSVVGEIPRVPGSPAQSRLVDVAGLARHGSMLTTTHTLEVWFRDDDPRLVTEVSAALQERGVSTIATQRLTDVRAQLDNTPAAWSIDLAGLVGGAAVLIAALVLLVVTSTTWRSRAADLASLRMSGVSDGAVRRIETLAQVPIVVVGVLVGAACGLVGAHYALPSVRQFNVPPEVSTTDFSTPWEIAAAITGSSLVLLGLLAWAVGRWTARRAGLTTVRAVM